MRSPLISQLSSSSLSSSLYERLITSPHLSDEALGFSSRYLSPDELRVALQEIIALAERTPHAYMRVHELGVSPLGCPLIGWTLGEPHLPRLICASQHHGPENYGAAFSVLCSHLLLSDPLFEGVLSRFSVSFFPQQNPEALERRGNLAWMREPSWERFIEAYQYDPRRLDVEHGVPPEWLPQGEVGALTNARRPEATALTRWMAEERKAYGAPVYYQSGHAWSLLDAPLYLMYPNLPLTHPTHPLWADRVSTLSALSPYKTLACAAPLNDDYELPAWPQEGRGGFYVLPTRAAFLKRNPQSEVMCSSMDIAHAHSPNARILVIEPPIFTSELIKGEAPSGVCEVEALKAAAQAHERALRRVDELWRSELSLRLQGEPLEQAYLSENAEKRALARLRLEGLERGGVGARWSRLADNLLSAEGRSPCELRAGHTTLATLDQHFSTANYLSLALSLTQDSTLKSLSEASHLELSKAQLTPWPVSWGVFVYLCPLLATLAELE